MSRRTRVLYVCHNHPSVRPGGAEEYAHELFRAVRREEGWEAVFLAKGGPPLAPRGRTHSGTLLAPIPEHEDQYFLYTDGYETDYDWTFGTWGNKDVLTKHLREFLLAVRPDVVHFQHTLFFGYDALRLTRNVLPGVPILYTLHEYLPICRRQGQLVRTADDAVCPGESPQRCHDCFPEIAPETFFLRKRFIQSHLALVDLFVAPSAHLRDRYVEWGLPPERILLEEYGREPEGRPAPLPPRTCDRIGYFGQLSRYKGVDVLLEAMTALREDDDPAVRAATCRIHGANLDLQEGDFAERFHALLGRADNVTFVGRYAQHELPRLMEEVDWVVVPSIWPENSPLVIQEASFHGRPVICSALGGMAEKVADGVTGLHFRTGDAASLAATLRRAITTPGLHERLRQEIRPPYAMERHVRTLTGVYRELVEARARPEAARAG